MSKILPPFGLPRTKRRRFRDPEMDSRMRPPAKEARSQASPGVFSENADVPRLSRRKMCLCCSTSQDTISIHMEKPCRSCLLHSSTGVNRQQAALWNIYPPPVRLGFCSHAEDDNASQNHIFSATFTSCGPSKHWAPCTRAPLYEG